MAAHGTEAYFGKGRLGVSRASQSQSRFEQIPLDITMAVFNV